MQLRPSCARHVPGRRCCPQRPPGRPVPSTPASTASDPGPSGQDTDDWEVVWCLDAWEELADRSEAAALAALQLWFSTQNEHPCTEAHSKLSCRLEPILPSWANLVRYNPRRPLREQVELSCANGRHAVAVGVLVASNSTAPHHATPPRSSAQLSWRRIALLPWPRPVGLAR